MSDFGIDFSGCNVEMNGQEAVVRCRIEDCDWDDWGSTVEVAVASWLLHKDEEHRGS